MVFEMNKRNSWNIYISIAQRIMNSEININIGVSPNDLVFGGQLKEQKYLIHETLKKPEDINLGLWSADMLSMQLRLTHVAQKRQQTQDESHMRKGLRNEATGGLQSGHAVTEFRQGSFVLVKYPTSLAGKSAPPTKLHTQWKGPMRVLSNIGPQYLLHDLVKDKDKEVHITGLKSYNYDPRMGNPQRIAAKDNEEDEIGSILNHAGNIKKLRTLDFLVHWKDQDDSEDLWLPWKELRLSPILHEYLKNHGMRKLIPKQFLTENLNSMEQHQREPIWSLNELTFEWVKT